MILQFAKQHRQTRNNKKHDRDLVQELSKPRPGRTIIG